MASIINAGSMNPGGVKGLARGLGSFVGTVIAVSLPILIPVLLIYLVVKWFFRGQSTMTSSIVSLGTSALGSSQMGGGGNRPTSSSSSSSGSSASAWLSPDPFTNPTSPLTWIKNAVSKN